MFLLVSLILATTPVFSDEPGPNPKHANTYPEAHRFVFYAVIEGCYNDGLIQQDLDLIIPADPDEPEISQFTTHFVYACPLCHPTYEAFRIYSYRKPFAYQKPGTYNTFGQGLSESIRDRLRGEPQRRRDAIQELIQRWIDSRIKLLRLDPDETKELRAEFAEMKKKGEDYLKSHQENQMFGDVYDDWKKCPICDGASPMGGVSPGN